MKFSTLLHKTKSAFSKETSDALLENIRNGKGMTRREQLNLIVMLSIPSVLAQVTHILMFFIDASMVGRLGAEPSASIGLVESTTWLLGSLTGAVSVGFSVQVAHAVGANDMERAREIFRHAIVCALIASFTVVAVGSLVAPYLPYWLGGSESIAHDASLYFLVWVIVLPFFQMANLCGGVLKSSGDMRVPSFGSVMMCVLDVVFNYIFIFQCHLGVLGAALGSALAIAVNACYQGFFAIVENPILSLYGNGMRFSWNGVIVKNAAKIASPVGLQTVFLSGAQIVSTAIVAPLGVVAIATNTFAITAESLCYMPGYGIGDAATTLIGQSTGAQRNELTWSFSRMTVSLAMLVMAFMGVVMYVFAPEMMALLSPVDAIQQLGTEVLRIEAWAEPGFAASIVCYSCMVGAGDTLRPAIMNFASMWLVRLTLAAILAPTCGLQGVWFAMATELCVRGAIFLIRLWRRRWIK